MKRVFLVSLAAIFASESGVAAPLSIGFAKDRDRSVEVRDGKAMLVAFKAVRLAFSGKRYRFVNGGATATDGGYEVAYRAPDDFPKGLSMPTVKGRFTRFGDDAVDVRFTVGNVSSNDGLSASCMLSRQHGKSLARGNCLKGQGRWVRSANGGQPWEERLDNALEFVDADGCGIAYLSERLESGEPAWCGPWEHHTRLVKDEKGGGWTTGFRIVRIDGVRTPYAQVCAAAGMPAQVTLKTTKTYNWFESASGDIAFTGEILNVQASARRFEVSWWVRGFNGERFGEGRQTVEIPSFGTATVPARFNPLEPRGIYFVEMSARDCADGREAFDRMNIARLPPHKFKARPENSPFGIAAYFPIPDEDSVQKLMDRMGVMWVRHGDTRIQHPPRVAWRHGGNHAMDKYNRPGRERDQWIIGEFEACRTNRNEYWEFGNELNGAVPGIGLKCHGIGLAVKAPAYVEFLKDIHRIRKERGYEDIKIVSLGLAGYDSVFVRRIKELGGWGCLDGLSLHPGRGNFTPDYPYFRPEAFAADAAQTTDDPRSTEKLQHSSYWNFLGAVRSAIREVREYGDMPIWLTEIYTPGAPNTFWDDNWHDSADNVVLMYTLIKADGVKCGMFYQMFDGVWFDKLGVNPKNREYFFGMITRDLSFKPSMMAYCNIAEVLDEASFAGWMKSRNATTHAALFRTPRGPMAVIWDRTEGMILNSWNKGVKPWPSPDPWVGSWKKRIAYDIPVKGKVTAINPIGQRFDVPVSGGKAHLQLTGSPLIVYGVDLGGLSIVH